MLVLVSLAQWTRGYGSFQLHGAVGVDVKTLQSSSSQEDRVKFLRINGQFRHPNWVPELAIVVTVGEPVSKQIFCFVCIIIVYTTLKNIPYTFRLYVKGKHLVHSIPMEGNFIAHIETVQFHCVQWTSFGKLYIILHVYIQLCNHGNHIVTVGHDCVGVGDEWRPRIKQCKVQYQELRTRNQDLTQSKLFQV